MQQIGPDLERIMMNDLIQMHTILKLYQIGIKNGQVFRYGEIEKRKDNLAIGLQDAPCLGQIRE
ncbi:MAG: hypothetical protein WBN68_17455 [Sedimenticolaceae bacterium]